VAAAGLVLVVSAPWWTAGDDPQPGAPAGAVTADGLRGPLCDQLPKGDEPGAPQFLREMAADEALTWMPVLTVFEAGARATGIDEELRTSEGVTILAPSDDTFARVFGDQTLDDLLLSRTDELRALLEAHIVGELASIDDMVVAGRLTTLSGDTLTVRGAEGLLQLNDRAGTLCGDYQAANARIHIIDGLLGDLPAPTSGAPHQV